MRKRLPIHSRAIFDFLDFPSLIFFSFFFPVHARDIHFCLSFPVLAEPFVLSLIWICILCLDRVCFFQQALVSFYRFSLYFERVLTELGSKT